MREPRTDYKDFPIRESIGTLFAWIDGKLVWGYTLSDKIPLVAAAKAQGDTHVFGVWNGQWRSEVFRIPVGFAAKGLEG